jgi:hypothetical protein
MPNEPQQPRQKRGGVGIRHFLVTTGAAICLAGSVATVGVISAHGQDAGSTATQYDESAINLGFRVWKDKVWCGQCHGWAGNGLPDDPRAPVGANLRETALTPEQMYTIIQCGIPGTEMPAFDARAYIDDRCYGVTADQLGDQTPQKIGVYLIPREINGLIAYLFTNVVGKGPFTDEDCRAYYGEDATICDTIRAGGVAQPPQRDAP